MSRTTETWRSVPEWLAVASASRSPSRGAPAVRQASACSGLEARPRQDRRGRCRRAWRSTCRRASRTIAMPVWRDSTKPLRSTTASSTASAAAKVCGTTPAYRRRPPRHPACQTGAHVRRAPLRPPHHVDRRPRHGHERLPRLRPRRRRSRSTASPTLLASSDKPFRGDPSRWNPEDLLLAALSECHLLSYLHACVQAGVVVVGVPATRRRA